jgi:hypothetical protein
LEGGPPIFRQDFPCPALLVDPSPGVPYGALTRSGAPFQALPVPRREAAGLVRVRSPLLTESHGSSKGPLLMSFPPANEMFQFAGFASPSYGFRERYPASGVGCPIRRSRDQRLRASPPGFSQRAASFLASQCQGIHQMPFLHTPHPEPPLPAACPRKRGAGRNRTAPRVGSHPFARVRPVVTSLLSSPVKQPHPSPAPGGGDRVRTGALLLAKQALSRLSYTPLQKTVISHQ